MKSKAALSIFISRESVTLHFVKQCFAADIECFGSQGAAEVIYRTTLSQQDYEELERDQVYNNVTCLTSST